jgi:hypothetical protein
MQDDGVQMDTSNVEGLQTKSGGLDNLQRTHCCHAKAEIMETSAIECSPLCR